METPYQSLMWCGDMCTARQPQQSQLGRRDSLVARVLTAEAQSLDVTKVQRLGVQHLHNYRGAARVALCGAALVSAWQQLEYCASACVQMAPLGDRLLVQPEEESGVCLRLMRCSAFAPNMLRMLRFSTPIMRP